MCTAEIEIIRVVRLSIPDIFRRGTNASDLRPRLPSLKDISWPLPSDPGIARVRVKKFCRAELCINSNWCNIQHFHKTLAVCTFSSFFLRGSQERKDLALNPKRVELLVVGKDQQRTCAVMGRKCRVKPVVPRLPGQTFHWSKSAD